MESIHINPNVKAFSVGVIAGMRSMSAPALISHFLCKVPADALQDSPLRIMQMPLVSTGLKILAGTEIIADKLPGTPNRIALPVLMVRGLAGALAGLTLNQANKETKWTGALLGGLGAIAGSYGFFYLRKQLSKSTNLPDPVWAVLEDVLMLAAGINLAKTPPTKQ